MSGKDFSSINKFIELIKNNSSASQLEPELNSQELSETYVTCLLSFSLAVHNKEIFNLLKVTYPAIVDSILVLLQIDPKSFEYDFLINKEWERNLLHNEAMVELIKASSKELALSLVNLESNFIIFHDVLSLLVQMNNLQFIDQLLSKDIKYGALKNSEEDLRPLDVNKVFSLLLGKSDKQTIIEFIKKYNIPIDNEMIARHNQFRILDAFGEYENPTPETLLSALNFNAFEYLLTNNTYFLDYVSTGEYDELMESLIRSCTNFEDIEAKLYLFKTCAWYSKQKQAHTLLKNLEVTIVGKLNERPNILDYTHNPIKLAVLIIEVTKYLGKKHKMLHIHYTRIKDELMKYVKALNNEITNEESLRLLYLEEDFEGREVLYIIQTLKLHNMLEDSRMRIIVRTLWESNYILGGNFMSTSHLYRLLFRWPLNSKVDVEGETRTEIRNINYIPYNSFNFNVWKKGIAPRYITQAIAYFALAIYFQVLLYFFLRKSEQFVKDPELEIAVELYNDFYFILKCSFVWYILIVQSIFDYAFRVHAKRSYRYFTVELGVLLVQVISTTFITLGSQSIERQCKGEFICFSTKLFKEQPFFIKEFLSFMMLCIWVRAAMTLNASKVVGPLITATLLMIRDMLKFMLLFALISVGFGCFFSLLLIQIKDFRNPLMAIYNLYMAAMLILDPSILDDGDERTRFYSHFFMVVYLLISAVILINLLTGIFTITYFEIKETAMTLYFAQTIKLRPIYKYDKRHSYYVSAPFPLNIILISALPFICSSNQNEEMNTVMLHIEYLPFMIVSLLFYFLLNLVLLPFAYLKIAFHKFLLMVRQNDKSVIRKFISFLFYLSFGILLLIVQLILDCILFVRHLYSNKLEKLFKDKREIERFEPSTLKHLLRFLYDMRKGNARIEIDELFTEYESHTKIDRNGQNDLEALKKILLTQEFEKGYERYIDVNAAYCLLKSVSSTWKYFEIVKGGRSNKRKYAKRRAILKNINRRIVCQQSEIPDKVSSKNSDQ